MIRPTKIYDAFGLTTSTRGIHWQERNLITGAHTIIYAEDAEAARAFLQDTLGLPNVDAGDGWLIFKAPPSELAVHPTSASSSGKLELYLMCDDIEGSVAELKAKGVEVTSEVEDAGWGLLTTVAVPGAGEIGLYEPRHPVAYDLD